MERGVIVSLPFFEFSFRRSKIYKGQEKVSQAKDNQCLGVLILDKY